MSSLDINYKRKQFIRQRRWIEGLFLLLPCAYFLMGTLLVATASIDTRARVMVTPLLAVMAAHGAVYWLTGEERRRRPGNAWLVGKETAG